MKIIRSWTGKKQPTNPDKKEQHIARKNKRIILLNIKGNEYKQEIIEYKKNANQPFQK